VNISKNTIFCILLLLGCCFYNAPSLAAQVSADAVVQDGPLYVGDSFTFQIRVSGSDQPNPPDLSTLDDFSVQYQGGSQNNSSSITIINGKMTKNVSRGYVFSYQLTPKQTGTLTIPSVFIQADGSTVGTRPISVNILKPETTDDIKLQLFLSKDQCYVGEPIVLKVIWYLRKDVRSFNFMIPLLEKTDWFYFIDPEIDQQASKKYYRIPLADGEVIAEQGKNSLDGIQYSTITFSKILIPQKTGDLSIDPATVACEILTGYRNSRGRNPFGNDFFSGAFGGRQGVYKKVVVSSNALRLKVNQLPIQGKPANFAGHMGQYKIFSAASPTNINVGDPITLSITLSGPEYLDQVSLPLLTNQANLTRDFKIPKERATGETRDNTRVFTQTLRALRSDVKQIPSIELPYFDTITQQYKIARTQPIPITVKATRVVTALDAEGRSLTMINGSEVKTWTKGIAYNYEDLNAINDQRLNRLVITSPSWMASLILPPLIYLLTLLTIVIIRKKQADPQTTRSKKAYAKLNAELKKIMCSKSDPLKTDMILAALRNYLGAKLRMSHRAIVFSDAQKILAEKGVSKGLIDTLKSIFDACEADRYAGISGAGDHHWLSKQTLNTAKKLESIFQ